MTQASLRHREQPGQPSRATVVGGWLRRAVRGGDRPPRRRATPWGATWAQWSPLSPGPVPTQSRSAAAESAVSPGAVQVPAAGGSRVGGWRRTWRRLPRLLVRWPVVICLTFAVAIAIATDQTSPQTNANRLTDLRNYYQVEQTGMSSCSGGLRDSLIAYRAILTGASTDRTTAESIAVAGSQACSPTSNGDLYDMATNNPPRDLLSLGVGGANAALYQWAFPTASRAQLEIQSLLENRQGPGSPMWRRLQRDLATLRTSGARIQATLDKAATRLGGSLAPLNPSVVNQPRLPG